MSQGKRKISQISGWSSGWNNRIVCRLSRHAERRRSSRGIGREVVDVLLEFGKEIRARKGAFRYEMDRCGRLRAKQALGLARYRRIVDRLNAYVIVGRGGKVVTVAHRLRRYRRPSGHRRRRRR